ncbi:MAG: class I SAM-dependent methyltransferase [Thermoplasmata archaeon]|nr:class I SAM-dependent methyltransferase [Thermoplasmata archaeon]
MGNPTKEFWDRTYREDPDFFGAGASSLARSSLGRLTREANGGSLLELGCGTGRDLCYFAQHGFEVAGCELSPVAAREANLRLSALREEVPPRSRVTVQDALELLEVLPAGRTDVVYSNLFFNLEIDADRLRRMFRNVARVLRPGGLHLFTVRSTSDPWYGKGTRLGSDRFDPGTGGPPLRFFDEPSLRQLTEPEFEVDSLREHSEGGPEFPVVIWSAVTQRRAAPSSSRP